MKAHILNLKEEKSVKGKQALRQNEKSVRKRSSDCKRYRVSITMSDSSTQMCCFCSVQTGWEWVGIQSKRGSESVACLYFMVEVFYSKETDQVSLLYV